MTPTALILAGALLTQLVSPQQITVQDSMAPAELIIEGCFELRGIDAGEAMLRFTVGADGRAHEPRLEGLIPQHPSLGRCVLAAIRDVRFPFAAVGADVAYPIRYHGEAAPERAGGTAAPVYQLRREPRTIGSTWRVIDERGRGVSDIDLALAAGAQELHAELSATETRYGIAALIEGTLAAGGIAAGIVGVAGLADPARRADQDLNIGLTAAGAGTTAIAGSLFLYHVFRFLEVDAPRPLWHTLDAPTARKLIAQANTQVE